jgi:predicted permease
MRGAVRQDLRYALRGLRRQRRYSVAAVLTLALGIGANAAAFSVVYGVLLRPLSYTAPERLVWVWDSQPGAAMNPVALPEFLDWRRESRSFEAMAAIVSRDFTLGGSGQAERISGVAASAELLEVLGLAPALGRGFRPQENHAGQGRVVMLTQAFWRRTFGADAGVVGRSLLLDGERYEVVGVLPDSFRLAPRAQVWTPLDQQTGAFDRGPHSLMVLARLAPGVPVERAQAELQQVARGISEAHPGTNVGHRVRLEPMLEWAVGHVRTTLLALLGAVGFVLLIACANVANLLLARASGRRRELAIRSALGASRARLAAQLLTESALVALLGGAVGLALAYGCTSLLVSLQPPGLPRLRDIRVDLAAVGFTTLIALLTGLLFGLAPALFASKLDANGALREGRAGGTTRHGRSARRVLVVAELALTLVLLTGAALMLQTLSRLRGVELGFETDGALSVGLLLPEARYPDEASANELYRRLLERVQALPGVESAGVVTDLPLTGSYTSDYFRIEGRPAPGHGEGPGSGYHVVSPGFFDAMGIRVLRGRGFTEEDAPGTPGTVVISDNMARRHWPAGDAIGQRVLFQGQRGGALTIVGVVSDVRYFDAQTEPLLEAYVPYRNNPLELPTLRSMTLVVRGAGPASLIPAVRRELHELDADIPAFNVKSLDERLADTLAPRRFHTTLLGAFAAIALALALVGVYGVIAYTVSQRKREIGLRMALGARRSDVVRLVLGEAALLAALGVATGTASALALSRFVQGLLHGVRATDVTTLALVSALLVSAAILASAVPAARAARVEPLRALREE